MRAQKIESVFSPSFCREIPRRNRAIELGLRFLFQEIHVFETMSCGFLKCAFPRNSHFREDVVWLHLVFQENRALELEKCFLFQEICGLRKHRAASKT